MRKSVAVLLALTTIPLHSWTAAAAPSQSAGPRSSSAVTLITGDRVEVQADGTPRVTPAKGRESVPRRITRRDGHWSVVPVDAAGLVENGRLDPHLFDVTELLEQGYGDDKKPVTPVIVENVPGAAAPADRLPGTKTTRALA